MAFQSDIPSSEITPESVYLKRREFMKGSLLAGAAMAGVIPLTQAADLQALAHAKASPDSPAGFFTDESLTPFDDVARYNNFYEFGLDKRDPAKYADKLKTRPWSVTIEGEVDRPGTYDLDELLKGQALEERIYRLRCVEAWSMVVPWVGFPLSSLLSKFGPTSRAKYVAFETLYDPEQMPGQKPSFFSTIDWPYVEGLRMDEAMHPLTILAVGLYGRVLPNQNGAPLRLVVPWKYGFKSIKSIVKIRLQESEPPTTWNKSAPEEYGFYANVNPYVDHPRWSQKFERRLPSSLLGVNRIPTQPFNGYSEQVADLYQGMDLARYY